MLNRQSQDIYYHQVYQAAQQSDEKLLNEALKDACIDVISSESLPAVAKLAYQNNKAAVNFLIQHGASVHWAAMGFAMQNNSKTVEWFIQKCKATHPQELYLVYSYVAQGFARQGNFPKMYHYLRIIEKNYLSQMTFALKNIACELALAGHTQALQGLKIWAENKNFKNTFTGPGFLALYPDSVATLKSEPLIELEAITQALRKCLDENATEADVEELLCRIAYDLTRHNCIDVINQFAAHFAEKTLKLSPHGKFFLQEVAYGFAYLGKLREAWDLLEFVEKQFPQYKIYILTMITIGLCHAKHIPAFENWLKQIKNESENFTLIDNVKINHYKGILENIPSSFARFNHAPALYEYLSRIVKEDSMDIQTILGNTSHAFAITRNFNALTDLLARMEKDYESHLLPILRATSQRLAKDRLSICYEFISLVKSLYPKLFNNVLSCLCSFAGGTQLQSFMYPLLIHIKQYYPNYLETAVIEISTVFSFESSLEDIYDHLEFIKINYSDYLSVAIDFSGLGLAKEGREETIYSFIEKIKTDYPNHLVGNLLNTAAAGFGRGNQVSLARKFYEKIKLEYSGFQEFVFTNIVFGFGRSGDEKSAYEFMNQMMEEYKPLRATILEYTVRGLFGAEVIIAKKVVLKVLAETDDEDLRMQCVGVIRSVFDFTESHALLQKANDIHHHMKKWRLNYAQVLGWMNPETRLLLTQGCLLLNECNAQISNLQKLPLNPLLHLATFLSCMSLEEMSDLSNKLNFETYKFRLFNSVKKEDKLIVEYVSISDHQLKKGKI